MTRLAFLSDVHGNLEALECVREDIAALAIDRIVCLGDVVSYNADQRTCMERVVDGGMEWIAGNHDLIASGLLSPVRCGAAARYAALKARRALDPTGRQHIRGLPLLLRDDAFIAFHGSLRRVDEYLLLERDARAMMDLIRANDLPRVAFFGHTHRACVWTSHGRGARWHPGEGLELDRDEVHLVNVGSVGEPRDADRHATYVLFDSRSHRIEFRRLDYDYAAARRKSEAGGWRRAETSRVGGAYDRARRRLGRLRHLLLPRPSDDSSLHAIRRRQTGDGRRSVRGETHEAAARTTRRVPRRTPSMTR